MQRPCYNENICIFFRNKRECHNHSTWLTAEPTPWNFIQHFPQQAKRCVLDFFRKELCFMSSDQLLDSLCLNPAQLYIYFLKGSLLAIWHSATELWLYLENFEETGSKSRWSTFRTGTEKIQRRLAEERHSSCILPSVWTKAMHALSVIAEEWRSLAHAYGSQLY